MGPASLRTAQLGTRLAELDWIVTDLGDLSIPEQNPLSHTNPALRNLADAVAWTKNLTTTAYKAATQSDLAIFLGGDHSMSAGTVAGMAKYAATQGRPLFVLWIDAHPDFHTLTTTESGNLHGIPVSYFTDQGVGDPFPRNPHPVPVENICMMGIRSVDPAEHRRIAVTGLEVHDMRAIDETGILPPLHSFLDRIRVADGLLHVSLDVDGLDPEIAPAVGTTVPGGLTFREAHLIMETLYDSGLVRALDLVELNPFLDERGRTASLLVDLTASLMGRRVLDRMTRSFAA